jgi:preprotein translocase subunit SecF
MLTFLTGVILLAGAAIITALILIFFSERRRAAVGRRCVLHSDIVFMSGKLSVFVD